MGGGMASPLRYGRYGGLTEREVDRSIREQDRQNQAAAPRKKGIQMAKNGARIKRLNIKSTRSEIDTLYEELTEALDAVDVAARRESTLDDVSRRIDTNRFPAAGG
jgi:hypothetical protein